jgi:hypothetical protein
VPPPSSSPSGQVASGLDSKASGTRARSTGTQRFGVRSQQREKTGGGASVRSRLPIRRECWPMEGPANGAGVYRAPDPTALYRGTTVAPPTDCGPVFRPEERPTDAGQEGHHANTEQHAPGYRPHPTRNLGTATAWAIHSPAP